MNIQNGWTTAKAVNGEIINVNVVPLHKYQRSSIGHKAVEVSKQIVLESGRILTLNIDGRSFYTDINKLYKLNIPS